MKVNADMIMYNGYSWIICVVRNNYINLEIDYDFIFNGYILLQG